MLLGKRPRPAIMKRTTSMSGGLDVETQTTRSNEEVVMSDSVNPNHHPHVVVSINDHHTAKGSYIPYLMAIPLSPTTSHNHTTNTHLHTSHHFLRTCGLCNSHLPPGRDIYMYSLECREKQMKKDQRKDKWKAGTNKASPPGATAKA